MSNPTAKTNDIDVLGVIVEGYHKRIHDLEDGCEKRCSKYGERLGSTEQNNAVQASKIDRMEKCVDEIQKAVNQMQVRVALSTAGIMALFKGFEFLLSKH